LQKLRAKHPGELSVLCLDVTDESAIAAAVGNIQSQVDSLDLLINSAGVYPRGETTPCTVTAETLLYAFRLNSIGPLIVAQHCLNLLRKGRNPKIVNISSKMGSLWWKEKEGGGDYSYCSSKAALNMLTRTVALDLRKEGIIAVVVNPGWVKTDMGGETADLTPSESVGGLLDVIRKLTMQQTGRFFSWTGEEHPW
jgi:NAD(P)-dependent dehydrogenase (short-subunit alcohol dehydrogenase family)